MHCPRCGVEQPPSDECIACGIIFTKYVESLGRDRDTIPPGGASPISGSDVKVDAGGGAQQATGPTTSGHGTQPLAGAAVNPKATQPTGHHLSASQSTGAIDVNASPDPANPFTQTQERPADPFADTRTGPVTLPTAQDLDPFAPPSAPDATPTSPNLDPFGQPPTRHDLPAAEDYDPFAAPTTAHPTQPVVGSAYPPPSQVPTVQTLQANVEVDPLSGATWEEQLESAVASQSGAIPGNVHDLTTVPPESYAISPAAEAPAPVSVAGDANYQAMLAEAGFGTETETDAPAAQQPAAEVEAEPQAAEPQPTAERAPAARSRFQRARPEEAQSIHPLAAGARILGAIACLAIAVLMMFNGRGLMSVMPYVIMVAYGCAALWGLTTYKGKITVRQFAIEMCVLVAVTLTLRTASPEMFSVDAGEDKAPVRAVIKPHLPKNALGRYTERALEVLTACDELANPLPTTNAERATTLLSQVDTEGLADHYKLLPPEEQARVDGIEKRVKSHAPVLLEAVQAHLKTNGPDARFRLEGRKVHDAQRELGAALLRAQGLRARILVVPDGVTSESMHSAGE
ncbi:MAG: hypothetical protein CL940_10780 [Deltaproteobacteria bacterium]|nr:hypothetical protein [Deltaproteobacteria bacterium]